MRIARGLALLLICALPPGAALSGCTTGNDAYCVSNDTCENPRPICDTELNACVAGDAGPPADCHNSDECHESNAPFCVAGYCVQCEDSGSCSVSAPVCEMPALTCGGCVDDNDCNDYPAARHCHPTGACVGCRDDLDCTAPGVPICGNDLVCHPCTADADCDSEVCDEPTGACIARDDVIYVDVGKASGDCSYADPCPTINEGVLLLSPSRFWMKIRPGTYPEQVTINGPTAILAADGAELAPTTNGAALTIQGTANVTVEGMTIRGADGTGSIGDGVRCVLGVADSPTCRLIGVRILECRGQGIETDTASLFVERSQILSNISGGLLLKNSDFSLVNNVIALNGGPSAGGGVVIIGDPLSGNGVFEFNTVADNAGQNGQASTGVQCLGITAPLAFKNSIIYGNQTTGTGTQVSGAGSNCDWTYSNIGPQSPGGNTNLNLPPQFAAPGDYHLGAGSPCIDQAEPNNPVTDDMDGRNTRPTGDGLDMGADERP